MKYVLIIPILLLLLACNKENSQADKDDQIINDYLSQNSIEATKHSSGLYYTITTEGSGSHPTATSTVEVRYTGYLTDNTVFDQTDGNTTATFNLQGLITGWQIGIPLLKVGGKGTFFLPSALGYGSQSTGNIPGNSVLIFDIELVNIQ